MYKSIFLKSKTVLYCTFQSIHLQNCNEKSSKTPQKDIDQFAWLDTPKLNKQVVHPA